jgi:hypothetical protein
MRWNMLSTGTYVLVFIIFQTFTRELSQQFEYLESARKTGFTPGDCGGTPLLPDQEVMLTSDDYNQIQETDIFPDMADTILTSDVDAFIAQQSSSSVLHDNDVKPDITSNWELF